MARHDVEKAKARGEYRLAGQLERLNGQTAYYGCHYGMRSEFEHARTEYLLGWAEIEAELSR